MVGVRYVGPYLDASGYGEATRNFLMAFREVDANVMAKKVAYTGAQTYKDDSSMYSEEMALKKIPYKINILHVTPDNYKLDTEADKYNIGHLFWETSRLPKSWVEPCNKMQEIWTGTVYGANVMKDSGVKVPIYVIPEAVKTDDPSDTLRPYVLPNFKGIIFYSIFEWTERKNPKALLMAFWKAFKGKSDVCLLLKVHKSGQTDRGLRDILLEARGWKNSLVWKDTPRVFMHADIMEQEELDRFHHTGNCFVSAHRGEGWGIPQCEAAMHKKPVISTSYGGIHEYFRRSEYYPVGFDLVPIDKTYNKYYEEGMEWAEVNQEELIARMTKVYEGLSNPERKGLINKQAYGGRNRVRETCSYKTVGLKMVERINAIAKERGWNE